jgi:hypothetical protein
MAFLKAKMTHSVLRVIQKNGGTATFREIYGDASICPHTSYFGLMFRNPSIGRVMGTLARLNSRALITKSPPSTGSYQDDDYRPAVYSLTPAGTKLIEQLNENSKS